MRSIGFSLSYRGEGVERRAMHQIVVFWRRNPLRLL